MKSATDDKNALLKPFVHEFEEHNFVIYAATQDRLDRVQWELQRVEQDALTAAERIRSRHVDLLNIEASPEKQDQHVRGNFEPGDPLPGSATGYPDGISNWDAEDYATLMHFLRLQLAVARCSAVLNELKPFYWGSRGDARQLVKQEVRARKAYKRRFAQFVASDPELHRDWKASGLTLEDLFEDAEDAGEGAAQEAKAVGR
jgi:hypothetical protein